MGVNEMTWNANGEEQTQTQQYALLEKGAYKVVLEKCELKRNQVNVQNCGMNLMFTVIDYDHETPCPMKNRKIFSYFCWQNDNETAVKIGRQRLADVLFAAGHGKKQYTGPEEFAEDLLGAEFFVNVIQKKRSDTGEIKNEIEAAFNAEGKARNPAVKAFKMILGPAQNIMSGGASDDVPF
jgi:Protein of unknown function (DUF669)